MDRAEVKFLEEVENLIGDPNDWTGSSEDEAVVGDPFKAGLMKLGFIDEDVLEEVEMNPDLLDLEEAVADMNFQEETESTFLYDSQKGKSHRRSTRYSQRYSNLYNTSRALDRRGTNVFSSL